MIKKIMEVGLGGKKKKKEWEIIVDIGVDRIIEK